MQVETSTSRTRWHLHSDSNMQKEMGISREAFQSENLLRFRPNVVLDTERSDGAYVPLIPFSKPAIVTSPIGTNPVLPGSGPSDVPVVGPLIDLLSDNPSYPSSGQGRKLGNVTVPLGPAISDTPGVIIDSARDDTPYYPTDLPVTTNPNSTVSNALTVTTPTTPTTDPISQITTLLDLFESRFNNTLPATVETGANQQGGYIIVPSNGGNGGNSPLLIWLAVAGIVLTIGFYIYERRHRK